jgi:hypothetical protein
MIQQPCAGVSAVNLRSRICYLLSILRIHQPDCEHCAARLACGVAIRKRLAELNSSAAISNPVVLVCQERNMRDGVSAQHIRTFDDGTALVRFAAGNFRIVPAELLKPATEAEAEEYYSVRAA